MLYLMCGNEMWWYKVRTSDILQDNTALSLLLLKWKNMPCQWGFVIVYSGKLTRLGLCNLSPCLQTPPWTCTKPILPEDRPARLFQPKHVEPLALNQQKDVSKPIINTSHTHRNSRSLHLDNELRPDQI